MNFTPPEPRDQIMDYTVDIIRVFTDKTKLTLGNPAGVVVSEQMLSAPEMQAIGIAAKQPITAFLSPTKNNDPCIYDIRYYDLGGRECHICGHATLAATAHLAKKFPQLNGKDLAFNLNPDLFNGENKKLTTHIRNEAISIDLFPSILRTETDPLLHNKIAQVLGTTSDEIDSIAFSVNIRDYVVILKNPQTLVELKPDFASMKQMAETGLYQHEGLMVSSKAPKGEEYDLYVRVFLPITGVNEDIACGSGNCSIIPFWHDTKNLNSDTKKYKTVFPFPEGKKGYLGGVQLVEFAPQADRITITAQVDYDEPLVVKKNYGHQIGAVRKNLHP